MTSLMILGGSGFFGKSILDAYRRGILDFWGVDRIFVVARNASRLNISHRDLINNSIQLIDADISTCQELPNADYVIHAAASTDGAKYLHRPAQERENVQLAVLNYCRLAKKYHQNSKIVYCSSGAVYGQQSPLVFGIQEDAKMQSTLDMPMSKRDYAAAKRDAEIEIQKLGLSGFSVCIARCFAFVGHYLNRDQHFAIGNFIEDGLKGRPIRIKSDHTVFRSYMYSDDLVIWLMTLAAGASKECQIFNVGSDEEVELHDLASMIAKYFSVPVILPSITSDLIDRYIPSITKARNELGLSLTFNLYEAISATINEIQ